MACSVCHALLEVMVRVYLNHMQKYDFLNSNSFSNNLIFCFVCNNVVLGCYNVGLGC